MLLQKRPLAREIERPLVIDELQLFRPKLLRPPLDRLDDAGDKSTIPPASKRRKLAAAGRQEHRPFAGRNGACGCFKVTHFGPIVTVNLLPNGPPQVDDRHLHLRRRDRRVPRHSVGKRVGCVDDRAGLVVAQIADKPHHAAKSAAPDPANGRAGCFGDARERGGYAEVATGIQRVGQGKALGGAAKYQEARFGQSCFGGGIAFHFRPTIPAFMTSASDSARKLRVFDRVPRVPMPAFAPGSVWLTGAGPGDPGLLTLQAVAALEQADVIFYDALVGDDVLDLAPETAVRAFVGKRGGKPSPKQGEITRRLIEAARAGKRVVRLKGGDPYVFGRGAEEALELAAAGVPFRIVPGVTAGIGGLAELGLPVTHRDYNQVLTLITAHDATGGLSAALDWDALARGSPVIVIYMGFRLLAEISRNLIGAGRSTSEPVAVVTHATTAAEKIIITTLGSMEADAHAAGMAAPIMIVIGEIVRLREVLKGQAASS